MRTWVADAGVDVFVVVSPENIYYLTGLDHQGYFAFTAVVMPAVGTPVIVTRSMELPTIRAQLRGYRQVPFADGTDPASVLVPVLAELVPIGGRIAVEEGAMFFPPSVRAGLTLPGRTFVDGTTTLARLRAIKKPAEIEHMRAAASISDKAMTAAISSVRPGAREQDVFTAAYHAMFTEGGQQPGFAPLIRPLWLLDQEHMSWADRPVGGDLFIELSGCVNRYHAPLSRTLYLGEAPAKGATAHALATAGLAAALDALRPGVPTGKVYAAWQRATGGSRHHCGYLVGIGYPPSWVGGEVLGIRPGGDVEIAPGMTFHLMSWVTEPAPHVVSDTALVTATGATLLTNTPRDLLVVT